MPSIVVNTAVSGNVQIWPQPGGPPLTQGMFVRVLGLDLTASAATVPSLTSGAGGPIIWETQAMNGSTPPLGIVLPVNKNRDIKTNPGQPLVLNNSNGVTLQGTIEITTEGAPV